MRDREREGRREGEKDEQRNIERKREKEGERKRERGRDALTNCPYKERMRQDRSEDTFRHFVAFALATHIHHREGD